MLEEKDAIREVLAEYCFRLDSGWFEGMAALYQGEFLIYQDAAAWVEEATARLADWVRAGRLKYREEIRDGIENCPGAIAELYRGENLGKRLIRLA